MNKEKKIIKGKTDRPDLEGLDEETVKNVLAMEKDYEEANKKAETNLLNIIRFKNKTDKFVFDRLPLSEYQKEQMVMEIIKEIDSVKDTSEEC